MIDGIQMVGDWRKQMDDWLLKDTLAVSMNVMGRTGEEACQHAMILLAESARATAIKSPKRRKIMNDFSPTGRHKSGVSDQFDYVNVYKQGHPDRIRLFKFAFDPKSGNRLTGSWEKAQHIANSGLAKRSWMWGLNRIGGHPDSSPIPGASKFYSILGDKQCGYIKEDKLVYIQKAMPAGWEREVESRANNKIMAQAEKKMGMIWNKELQRHTNFKHPMALSNFFRKAV